jgi:transcription termination/antitermination protein NusG
MPILPAEPFSFPTSLFSDLDGKICDDIHPADGDWYVLHTKSRAEKALARWLLARAVRFFLPLYQKQNERNQTSYAPLFPGYVFMNGGSDARDCAFASKQVGYCLPVHNQQDLETDLRGIYRLMTSDFPLTPVEQLQPGTPVEVIDGPFAGMTGKVLRTGSKTRLLVEIRMIGQGVSVEIDSTVVRPLTENGGPMRARVALIRR